jgi:hypothetical protein
MGLIKRTLIFSLLLLAIPFSGALYAISSHVSTENNMPLENGKMDLVNYLNNILIEAGVPDDSRKYLIDISRPALSNVDAKDIRAKKELLRKNLYILLIDLASKKPLLLEESKVDFSSKGYELTAAHFLSAEHMNFLKSNQVFYELRVDDVKVIFKSLCPIWPWC